MVLHFSKLATSFNVFFFLRLFPFHFRFHEVSRKYSLENGAPAHKIACALLQILVLYESTFNLFKFCLDWSGVSTNPSLQWVVGLNALASPLFILVYLNNYWKSGPRFTRIMEELQKLDVCLGKRCRWQNNLEIGRASCRERV